MIDVNRSRNRNIRLALLAGVTNEVLTITAANQYDKTGVGRSGYRKAIEKLVECGYMIPTEGGYIQTEAGWAAAMQEVSEGPAIGDGPRLEALYCGIDSCKRNASGRGVPVSMVIVEWYYR